MLEGLKLVVFVTKLLKHFKVCDIYYSKAGVTPELLKALSKDHNFGRLSTSDAQLASR